MTTSVKGMLIPLNDPVYRELHQAAKNSFQTKPVNLRLPVRDILVLKAQAIREGMPYQSIIRRLIHDYLESFNSNT